MKYRELTPNEIEAYNIGYKNGSRQAIIKVLEYETPEEKMFYRQGYNAGCQDRKRHNVKTCEIGSNVSNVSNVKSYDSGVSCESCDSTIANNNTITNTIVDSKESIGGVGGKREKINEDTHFYAGGQMWAFPFEFRALAKKYWTDETIREIEKSFSCQEKDSEVSIRMLLDSYPENKSEELRKNMSIKTYGENNKVRLTDEQYTKLQELYGRRLENAIQILDGYLAENKTREKKYTNHYAVMRRNNWVYNKTFDGDFVPLKPQVADMSKFVRAKPLGEEND